jgi:hypothetical protein
MPQGIGHALLPSPTSKGHIIAGALVGKMRTQRYWSWPATTRLSQRVGKTTTPITWSLLFDAGGDARVNGVPFAEERTAPWKEGWIETDVNLGIHGLE